MKVIKSFLLFLVPALTILSACQGQQEEYAFKGVINGAANLQSTLDMVHFDRSTVAIGKATSDADGKFTIPQTKAFEPGIYSLTIGAKKMFFVLGGGEKSIEIKGDLNTLDRLIVEVKGSEAFDCNAKIIQELVKTPLKTPEDARAVINKGCTPLMKAFLCSQLFGQNAGQFLNDFKTSAELLNKEMPGNKYTADFNAMINSITTQLAQQQQQNPEAVAVGQVAPEISLPGPDGTVHSLSKLKGKIVLLDFWASWCGPCRKSNPHVVEMYKKYNSKGFEVFSVSLDSPTGKEKWIQAIQQDGLIWPNHVSDLKQWDCVPAATYGVRAIPKTFLIGRDGKIIAINPRDNLEEELLKVL